jgi:ABC-type antimicrobial peptide transport system permease subunit
VPTLIGAVLAGLPSLVAVLIDLHWAGAVLAVALFAVWCARLPRAEPVRA